MTSRLVSYKYFLTLKTLNQITMFKLKTTYTLIFLAIAGLCPAQATKQSGIKLTSSDQRLEYAFNWAKGRALSYVSNGNDPVGKWYEAALPGRNAFCMRDASHQCIGAYYLGLKDYNKNMMGKFAASISEAKDWCGYWEIDKDDKPAIADYRSDTDFWYNLPANFDVMSSCLNLYRLTGDRDYLNAEPFKTFYQESVTEYPARWDSDRDGIMDSPAKNRFRGLASYYEANRKPIFTGADLVAAQANGFMVYAEIQKLNGNQEVANQMIVRSNQIRQTFNQTWWDEKNQRFYSYKGADGSFGSETITGILLYILRFDLVTDKDKRTKTLAVLRSGGENVEENSYLPSFYFKHGDPAFAYKKLLAMTDSTVRRRDYPEVSYSVIDAVVEGLMGVALNAPEAKVATCSQLPDELKWAGLENIPWKEGSISLKHEGVNASELTLINEKPVLWKAIFKGSGDTLWVNGQKVKALQGSDANGENVIFTEIKVESGKTYQVSKTKN